MPLTKVNSLMADAGAVLQVVTSYTGSALTGTTILPNDDTIPQNDEGTEFLTCSITPKSATSRLIVEVDIQLSASTSAQVIAALFRDSTAGAVSAMQQYTGANAQMFRMHLRINVAANSTNQTTFKVRVGPGTAATITLNGAGGNRLMGWVYNSGITITEVAV